MTLEEMRSTRYLYELLKKPEELPEEIRAAATSLRDESLRLLDKCGAEDHVRVLLEQGFRALRYAKTCTAVAYLYGRNELLDVTKRIDGAIIDLRSSLWRYVGPTMDERQIQVLKSHKRWRTPR